MKKALLQVHHPLKWVDASGSEIDTSAWRVHVIAGMLEGRRDIAGEAADAAWRDATRAVRCVAAGAAEEGGTVYAFGLGAADHLANLTAEWPEGDFWLSPPRPGIPAGTPEHDVIALKNSPMPPPDFVPGDVYKRIPAHSFGDEEWWPGRWSASGMALCFPARHCEYRERLENALQQGDYDLAQRLVLVSPSVSDHLDVSSFKSNPELLDFVTYYMMAGATANCVVGANFYFRKIGLTTFLDSTVDVLTSMGYECYRSKGTETFKQWAATGMLPSDLTILTRESLLAQDEGDQP